METFPDIRHVIHIADLHIRSGDRSQSRYDEYSAVFDAFTSTVAALPELDATILVMAGDVFHHKLQLHSHGIHLALTLFSRLSALLPVFVICGNHDYKQETPDEPDLIESLLSVGLTNVTYLKDTGTFVFRNVGFGLVSIKDVLERGNTSGIREQVPPFPSASSFGPLVNMRLALFHGQVTNKMEWFGRGWDGILLGDLHSRQISSVDNIPWGYPGSLLQQDFGETIRSHGFLRWSTSTTTGFQGLSVTAHDVVNGVGRVTLKRSDDGLHVSLGQSTWVNLARIANEPWFPKTVHLRILSSGIDDVLNVNATEQLDAHGIRVASLVNHRHSHSEHRGNFSLGMDESLPCMQMVDLASFNSPQRWIEYVREKVPAERLQEPEWEKWFVNHETLLPPDWDELKPDKSLKSKVDKVGKCIADFNALVECPHAKQPFFIDHLEWSHILCFGADNHLDFHALGHSIASISAGNGCGKTSVLECICISLFGTGFPSRTSRVCTASIICSEKPQQAKAFTSVCFSVGAKHFNLQRVFCTQTGDATKLKHKDVKLHEVLGKELHPVRSGKIAVEKWVDEHIGTCDTFLLSSMLTQNGDNDFFDMGSVDQQVLFDGALHFRASSDFQDLLKEARDLHQKVLDAADVYARGLSEGLGLEYVRGVEDDKDNRGDRGSDRGDRGSDRGRDREVAAMETLKNLNRSMESISRNPTSPPSSIHLLLELPKIDLQDQFDAATIVCGDDAGPHLEEEARRIDSLPKGTVDFDISAAEGRLRLLTDVSIATLSKEHVAAKRDLFDKEYGGVDIHQLLCAAQEKQRVLGKNLQKARLERMQKEKEKEKVEEVKTSINDLAILYGSVDDLEVLVNLERERKEGQEKEQEREKENEEEEEKEKEKEKGKEKGGEKTWFSTANDKRTTRIILMKAIGHLFHELNPSDADLVSTVEMLQQSMAVMSTTYHQGSQDGFVGMPGRGCPGDNALGISGLMEVDRSCETCKNNERLVLAWQTAHQASYDEALLRLGSWTEADVRNFTRCAMVLTAGPDRVDKTGTLEKDKPETLEKADTSKVDEEMEMERLERLNADLVSWRGMVLDDELEAALGKEREIEDACLKAGVVAMGLEVWERQLRVCDMAEERNGLVEGIAAHGAQRTMRKARAWRKMQDLRAALDMYDSWHEKEADKKRISEELIRVSAELMCLRNECERDTKKRQSLEKHRAFCDLLRRRHDTLAAIHEAFGSYKRWVYEMSVLPFLLEFANGYIRDFCGPRPVEIVCRCSTSANNAVQFAWFLQDGACCPPIEKASGFQRFCASLAVKIALGKFGAAGNRPRQLFLDEGFVACDKDAIARVGDFLSSLLGTYSQVLLVTHLEEVSASCQKHVRIERTSQQNVSRLSCGSVSPVFFEAKESILGIHEPTIENKVLQKH
jgi:Calcineurin-like phosphoesterase/AAA domain